MSELSYVSGARHSAWSIYLAQVERVLPLLGELSHWADKAPDCFCRYGQTLGYWSCRGVRVRPCKPADEKRLGESQHSLAR